MSARYRTPFPPILGQQLSGILERVEELERQRPGGPGGLGVGIGGGGGGGGGGVSGSGTVNAIPLWTGATVLGNSTIQDTGSQILYSYGMRLVKIGTSFPQARLDVDQIQRLSAVAGTAGIWISSPVDMSNDYGIYWKDSYGDWGQGRIKLGTDNKLYVACRTYDAVKNPTPTIIFENGPGGAIISRFIYLGAYFPAGRLDIDQIQRLSAAAATAGIWISSPVDMSNDFGIYWRDAGGNWGQGRIKLGVDNYLYLGGKPGTGTIFENGPGGAILSRLLYLGGSFPAARLDIDQIQRLSAAGTTAGIWISSPIQMSNDFGIYWYGSGGTPPDAGRIKLGTDNSLYLACKAGSKIIFEQGSGGAQFFKFISTGMYFPDGTFQSTAAGGGGAPAAGSYVTADSSSAPANYRILTAGNNITITDNPSGHTITVAATGGAGGIGGSGTVGFLPVFTATTTIGNSNVSQSGSTTLFQNTPGGTVIGRHVYVGSSFPTGRLDVDQIQRLSAVGATAGIWISSPVDMSNDYGIYWRDSAGNWGQGRIKLGTDNNLYIACRSGGKILFEQGPGGAQFFKFQANGMYFPDGTFQSTAGGGIGGSGTVNYIPKFTGTTTIGNAAMSDDGSTIGCYREVHITSPYARGFYRGRVIDWDTSDFWFGYSARAGNFIIGNGAGTPKFTVDASGNLWIAGKLTQAGCPPEWHDPKTKISTFKSYLQASVKKTEHVTGEEVYALMQLVLHLDKKVLRLEKAVAAA